MKNGIFSYKILFEFMNHDFLTESIEFFRFRRLFQTVTFCGWYHFFPGGENSLHIPFYCGKALKIGAKILNVHVLSQNLTALICVTLRTRARTNNL